MPMIAALIHKLMSNPTPLATAKGAIIAAGGRRAAVAARPVRKQRRIATLHFARRQVLTAALLLSWKKTKPVFDAKANTEVMT